MQKRMYVRLIFLLSALVFLNACSEYQRVLKSADIDYKLEKAIEYYDKGKYNKAYPLLEELLAQFRGSTKAETVYYYYGKTLYAMEDYILAAYHFKNFYKTFPNSKYEDECAFLAAYCHYQESPSFSLDQSYTYKAINELQLYVNTHPSSIRVPECNLIMDELRTKLERKSFETARQYYRMELYQSAVVAFNNSLNDFPDSQYREEMLFLKLLSQFKLAEDSIDEKKHQRFKETLTAYNELMQFFPETEYKKRAEEVRDQTVQKINTLKQINTWTMDHKKSKAAKDTKTRNVADIAAPTNNVYESLAIISKRAVQIGEDIKLELQEKLEEFNVHTDTLEEIFENKEQIELSRLYEALPKPTAMALQEWMEGKIYYRKPEDATSGESTL